MNRLALGLSALLLAATAQAAPRRVQPPTLEVMPGDEFPVPPIPPSTETPYLAAPVPNSALGVPTEPTGETSKGAKVTPGFYHPKDYNLGEGYLNGSTVLGEQERRAQPMPRLQLTMPLQ